MITAAAEYGFRSAIWAAVLLPVRYCFVEHFGLPSSEYPQASVIVDTFCLLLADSPVERHDSRIFRQELSFFADPR